MCTDAEFCASKNSIDKSFIRPTKILFIAQIKSCIFNDYRNCEEEVINIIKIYSIRNRFKKIFEGIIETFMRTHLLIFFCFVLLRPQELLRKLTNLLCETF